MMFPAERYVLQFFNTLRMDAEAEGHIYRIMLSETIKAFMNNQTKENAYAVYTTFFDIYRLGVSGKSFVDLLDILRGYEENAAAVIEGQRDHYIHSVNVFLLGLCIYKQNKRVREAVARDIQASGSRLFSTDAEEFLLRWGLAALFHDIGYPMEIINRQVNAFVAFVGSDPSRKIGPFVSFLDYARLNHINDHSENKTEATLEDLFDIHTPTDLMAYGISRKILVDKHELKASLDGFLSTMQKGGFVDHGYYSAIIVLKWYGEALLMAGMKSVFFNQVVDSAAAIFLHNAYKNVLQRKPYELGPLKIEHFPLAYLLILCDEAQEWNRTAYGIHADEQLMIDDSYTEITDETIQFHYITSKGTLATQFLTKKKELFYKLLCVDDVFPEGLHITANEVSDVFIERVKTSKTLPRLLAANIEKLARQIHADYNSVQLQRYPDRPLEYPTWDSLPDTLKYSNVRQAQTIDEKLRAIGCCIKEAGSACPYELTDDEIEYLAVREHNLWVEERAKNGWQFGEERDSEKKRTPYLVPYSELPEEIKELDRDAVRNMKPLLTSVGLMIAKDD